MPDIRNQSLNFLGGGIRTGARLKASFSVRAALLADWLWPLFAADVHINP